MMQPAVTSNLSGFTVCLMDVCVSRSWWGCVDRPAWLCPSCRERVGAGCRPEAGHRSGERQRARPLRATAGHDGGGPASRTGSHELRGGRRQTSKEEPGGEARTAEDAV